MSRTPAGRMGRPPGPLVKRSADELTLEEAASETGIYKRTLRRYFERDELRGQPRERSGNQPPAIIFKRSELLEDLAALDIASDRRSTAARGRAQARRLRARQQRGIAIATAAHALKVDRRILDDLYAEKVVDGWRAEGEIRLSRQELANYCWSQPRCPADGCNRRVLGAGPSCGRHGTFWGRKHSEEARRKKSEKLREGDPVEKTCEGPHCPLPGKRFMVSAHDAQTRPCRFHSIKCLTDWHGERIEKRLKQLREGRRNWRQWVALAKELGFLEPDEFYRGLPRELKRSPTVMPKHMKAGAPLEPWTDLHVTLFAPEQLKPYSEWLRHHPNGKLRRFHRRRFRNRWALGREAAALFRNGYSTAETARKLGYTPDYITKLWKKYEVTPEIEYARQLRKLLIALPAGTWIDFRDVYRAIHVSAGQAAKMVEDLVRRGVVERDRRGRRVILRRVSQIPD